MSQTRGTCHICARDVAVRKDGTCARHTRSYGGSVLGSRPCPGSGLRPTPPFAEALDVIRELVKAGAHDGPCTNEDEPEDGCDTHWETSERRRAAAKAFLALHGGPDHAR